MKKNLPLLLFFFLFASRSFSQSCGPDQSDTFWKIDGVTSKRLAPCTPTYNCHGFVMSYFENSCTALGWTVTPSTSAYTCPSTQGIRSPGDYQNSGRYVQVCDEADANIVHYTLTGPNGTHSAVKDVSGGGGLIKYISKYGSDGPLVGHERDKSFYQNQVTGALQFWTFVGKISGNVPISPQGNHTITGTGPVSFSAPPKTNVEYSWTVSQGGQNISITSGATSNVVTLSPLHSGAAKLKLWMRFVVNGVACGDWKSQEIPLSITTNICLEGTYTNNGISFNLNSGNQLSPGGASVSVTCPNATSYTWQKMSGSINLSTSTTFPYVTFNMTSGGTLSLKVTAKNGSTIITTRTVSFYNFGGSFSVAPNPASKSLTVQSEAESDTRRSLQIQSLDGLTSKSVADYIVNTPIDISDLPPGLYVIAVFENGVAIDRQRFVVKKE